MTTRAGREICVVGATHFGLTLTVFLAARGHGTVLVDLDCPTAATSQEAIASVSEPDVARTLADGLQRGTVATDMDAVHAIGQARVVWVAMDAPIAEDGGSDAAWLDSRLSRVVNTIGGGAALVVSSRVPVGTVRAVEVQLQQRLGGEAGPVLYVPENVRRGTALSDLAAQSCIVVGVSVAGASAAIAHLLEEMTDEVVEVGHEDAELAKHALNAFLATSVAFANELAVLAEHAGADYHNVERFLRRDPRVGSQAYVRAGLALGRGPLLREVSNLLGIAAAGGIEVPQLAGVATSHGAHARWLQHTVRRLVRTGAHVGVWGVAAKEGTSTFSDSLVLAMVEELAAEYEFIVYEPNFSMVPAATRRLMSRADSPRQAAQASDALVIGALTRDEVRSALTPAATLVSTVVDPLGAFRPDFEGAPGLSYVTVGMDSARVPT